MKRFEDLGFEERKEITLLFANWLKDYSHEVIVNVISQRDEIINNEFTMNMLKELKEREEKEEYDFTHSIGNLLDELDTFKEYDPHNHVLTHSRSYRDILRDMYFANRK